MSTINAGGWRTADGEVLFASDGWNRITGQSDRKKRVGVG